MVGTTIQGKYSLVERIGKNLLSVVYLAQDLPGDRLVTVKMTHPELTEKQDFSHSFRRSARLLGKVLSVAVTDDSAYTAPPIPFQSPE